MAEEVGGFLLDVGDQVTRLIAADRLEDLGRDAEAALLRDVSRKVYVWNGVVVDDALRKMSYADLIALRDAVRAAIENQFYRFEADPEAFRHVAPTLPAKDLSDFILDMSMYLNPSGVREPGSRRDICIKIAADEYTRRPDTGIPF